MAYNKQNFKSGDLLKASQLNAMDEQIAANEIALDSKQEKGDYLTSDAADSKYQTKGSYATSAENFSNAENWAYESSVSYWSAQKGLIEYLQKNIPTAKIFILILPYYKLKYPLTEGSNYLRTDGSFNMEYWTNELANSTATKLYNEQKLVAKYYSCTAIDVIENCSINPINIEQFYPSNDVHPKTSGYNVWGETIARLIN